MREFLEDLRLDALQLLGPDRADAAGLVLLLLLLVAAPFPYGGITATGNLVIELLAFLTGAAVFLSRAPRVPVPGVRAVVLALGGLALLGLLQLVPLPSAVLSLVSPESARVYAATADVLRAHGRPAPFPRVSIAPADTVDTILLTLAYLSAFLSAGQLLRTRPRRRLFVAVVLGAMFWHIGQAVLTQMSLERLHGPFVNTNHFAGYLEIGSALAMGFLLLILSYSRRGPRSRSRRHHRPSTDRIERALVRVSFGILVFGVVATGIGLTRSRGGLLAGMATVAFILLLAGLHALRKRRGGHSWEAIASGVSAAFLGIVFVTLSQGKGPIVRFLATDPRDLPTDTRVQTWTLSLEAWQRYPVLGSGLGSFREAFRAVQPRDFPGLLEQAHSDPIQLLVTGGVAGLALGLAATVAVLAALSRAWPVQPHREERLFALAGLGACVSLVLHGLVEFNFSVPAIPVTLAAVAGGALAASVWRDSWDRLPRAAGLAPATVAGDEADGSPR